MDTVESWHPTVHVGGRWSPASCTAWQKLAIIISYKDRYEQLILLLNRLHAVLQRQMMYYQIFVIEQVVDLFTILSLSFTRLLPLPLGTMFIMYIVISLKLQQQSVEVT